jgi:hypothetical protein
MSMIVKDCELLKQRIEESAQHKRTESKKNSNKSTNNVNPRQK